MKRKVGPLPLWAWLVMAGGTVGLVLYLRSSRTPSSSAVDTSLPSTAGAPPDASGGGGGGGTSSVDAATPPPTTFTTDDVYAALMNVNAGIAGLTDTIAALPGGQGVTDSASPTQTWAGEVQDVAAGAGALKDLAAIFQPSADTNAGGAASTGGSGSSERVETVTRPSAAHGGQQWIYHFYPDRPKGKQFAPVAPVTKTTNTTTHAATPAPSSSKTPAKATMVGKATKTNVYVPAAPKKKAKK